MLVLVAVWGDFGELARVAQGLDGFGVDGEGSERGSVGREGGKSATWEVVGVCGAEEKDPFRRGEVEGLVGPSSAGARVGVAGVPRECLRSADEWA